MEEKKLTENLRICSKTYHVQCGVTCSNKVCGSCRNILMAEAVDLINSKNETIAEQKAEIERLTEAHKKDTMLLYASGLACEQVKAENAELQKQVDELKELNAKYLDSIESLTAGKCVLRCELTKQAVKETAEKFAELLKGTVPQGLIDEIVKEITEGNSNDENGD